MNIEKVIGAIRQLRDDCNRTLTELEIDRAAQSQRYEIERRLDAQAKPQCGCGRDLLTNSEREWGVCHLCHTDDGTLLAEEQKYVPGAGV